MAEPALLEIAGLDIGFATPAGLMPALRDFLLALRPNEVVGLVGESGSGKSTVLFAAMQHLAANAVVERGSIRYRGAELVGAPRTALDDIRGRRIGMVFQDPGAALNPSMTIGAQIEEVLRRHFGLSGAALRDRVRELLALVRLDDAERVLAAYPHQLSGGMKQRAMIAMALAGEPEILLMDEPTTALDVLVQAHVLDLVGELRQRTGAAILFVSHDLGAVARIADRIGVLYAGELMEIGGRDDILFRSRNPYTRGLLAAVPRLDARAAPHGIPGFAAKEKDRFRRCVFAPRCGFAEAVCAAERPALVAVREGHRSRCHFATAPEKIAAAPASSAALAEADAADASPLLAVENLVVEYRRSGLFGGGRVLRAVDGVSLTLGRGRVAAVVGESGSGKSTLARAILRLERPVAGRVLFDGDDVLGFDGDKLRRYRRRVQMVFQNPTSSLNPSKTVLELVARPLEALGTGAAESRERARAALAAMGFGEAVLGRRPANLSGGEKQRVALARAFVTDPALVILDEPTTALDVSVQATILELLGELRRRTGCSYLLISHDLAVVRQLADDVVVMREGRVCEAGPAGRVFADPRDDYTRALLAAVPALPSGIAA